jgi:hypothetical protein
VPFGFGNGPLPLVGAACSDLRQELVFAHLDGPVAGRPVGEKPEHSVGRRTDEIDGRSDSLERFEQLVYSARRHAISAANRLDPDAETVANRVGSSDAGALREGIDLAHERPRQTCGDPLERGLIGGFRAGIRAADRCLLAFASRLAGVVLPNKSGPVMMALRSSIDTLTSFEGLDPSSKVRQGPCRFSAATFRSTPPWRVNEFAPSQASNAPGDSSQD